MQFSKDNSMERQRDEINPSQKNDSKYQLSFTTQNTLIANEKSDKEALLIAEKQGKKGRMAISGDISKLHESKKLDESGKRDNNRATWNHV